MTVETPQPRDRVRWQRTRAIEGVVEEITSDGLHIRAEDGRLHLCQVEDATVEVLGRARNRDLPVGTIKRLVFGAVYAKRDTRDGEDPWVYLYGGSGDGQRRTVGDDVAYSGEVIGAVPGTPAAEAQEQWRHCDTCECIHPPCGYVMGSQGCDSVCDQTAARLSVRVPNEPHGIPNETREKVAALAAKGDRAGAVREVRRGVSMGFREAVAYVESMSEYQSYLAAHGSTDVDPVEADRMRAMGFDRQPEFKVTDEQRAEIQSVLDERANEYVYGGAHGWKLDSAALTGVVADIVYAVRVQDRKRGDR